MKNVLIFVIFLFFINDCAISNQLLQGNPVINNNEAGFLDMAFQVIGIPSNQSAGFQHSIELIDYSDTTTALAREYYNGRTMWVISIDSVDIDICRKCKEEKNKVTITYDIKVYFDSVSGSLLMVEATDRARREYSRDQLEVHSPYFLLSGQTFQGFEYELPKQSFIDIMDISLSFPIGASMIIGVYGNYYYKIAWETRPMWMMTILGIPEFTSESDGRFDNYKALIDAETGKNYTYYFSLGK